MVNNIRKWNYILKKMPKSCKVNNSRPFLGISCQNLEYLSLWYIINALNQIVVSVLFWVILNQWTVIMHTTGPIWLVSGPAASISQGFTMISQASNRGPQYSDHCWSAQNVTHLSCQLIIQYTVWLSIITAQHENYHLVVYLNHQDP